MKAFAPLLFAASLLYAQGTQVTLPLPGGVTVGPPASVSATAPAEPRKLSVPDSHIAATINGKPFTVGDLRTMLVGAPPLATQAARTDPQQFLVWNSTMDALTAVAEGKGLHLKPPYKDRIEWTRNQVLMMALIEKQKRDSAPSAEAAEKWYRDNALTFGAAHTRIIYVAELEGKEDEAKVKLDRVLKRLKAGEAFEKVAREESDDDMTSAQGGTFPPIDKHSKIALEFRKQIFAAKPGSFVGPFRQPAGHYLFQLDKVEQQPFPEVQADIIDKMSEAISGEWMVEQRRQAEVKILKEDFFGSIAAANLLSQAGLPAPENKEEVRPETILATVNGQVFTAEHFTGIMQSIPPQVRTNAMQQPVPFLEQVALMRRLGGLAEAEKLHEQQPFRGRLYYNRSEILTQAAVDDYNNNIVVGPDEPKEAYDATPDRYRFAQVRALYVAYSLTPPPQTDARARKILNAEEARQKAESLLKEIRDGADFAETVRNHSDDENSRARSGELPQLRADDASVPESIRKAVFAAKDGDVVGPVQLPNGYYLIKVEKVGTREFAEVKDQIYEELRAQRFQKWFDGIRGQFQVEIKDPGVFQALAAQ